MSKRQSISEIGTALYVLFGSLSFGLNPRQMWVLNHLYIGESQVVTITELGSRFNDWLHHGNSTGSNIKFSPKTLQKLVERKLIKQNMKGEYYL